jgi:prepilin-type N-terminal cleavage/methylation domain-containing protein
MPIYRVKLVKLIYCYTAKLFKNNQQFNSGFTLLELLIAIAIVSVIFGLIISSASQVQRSGRDAQRQTDLRSIQAALQQYYTDMQYYPSSISIGNPLHCSIGNPFVGASYPCTSTTAKTYSTRIPQDPAGTPAYSYTSLTAAGTSGCDNSSTTFSSRCHKYCLYAKLEGGAINTPPTQCPLSGSYNYSVSQP